MVLTAFAFWLGLYFNFRRAASIRNAFVLAATFWAFSLVVILETLSVFNLVSLVPLGLTWGIGAMLLSFNLLRLKHHELPNKAKSFGSLDLSQRIILLLIGIVLVFTLLVSLVSPPNNADSQVYHLPRVMHWAQNQSVWHYPTFVPFQIAYPPAAEFAILNFQVLSGSDLLANFVQWFCLLGSVVVVTLISASLGGNLNAQIFSAFIGITIPMAILQASSTQNDLFAAFWVLIFAHFILKIIKDEKLWIYHFGAGISFGLIMLAKPTACFFAFPFIVWLFVFYLAKYRFNAWKYVVLFVLLALCVNFGHFYRNRLLYCSILGPKTHTFDLSFSPKNTAVKLVKLTANNFNPPFIRWNQALLGTVRFISKGLRVDINEPVSNFSEAFVLSKYNPHEDILGNPIHLFLLFLCLLLSPWLFKTEKPEIKAYFFCVLSGTVLVLFFIRYSHLAVNRYTLSMPLLFSPAAGIIVERYFKRPFKWILFILLVIFAFPPLFMNTLRPIIPPPTSQRSKYSILNTPRDYFRFIGDNETCVFYDKIVNYVGKKGYKNIGIANCFYEYPLWMKFKLSGQTVRIEHVGVENESASIRIDFNPQVIISFETREWQDEKWRAEGREKIFMGKADGRRVRLYFKGN